MKKKTKYNNGFILSKFEKNHDRGLLENKSMNEYRIDSSSKKLIYEELWRIMKLV